MKTARFYLIGMFVLAALLATSSAASAAASKTSTSPAPDIFQRLPSEPGTSHLLVSTGYFMRTLALASSAPIVTPEPATDFYQRHSKMRPAMVEKTAKFSGEDFFLRHTTELGASRSKEIIYYHMRPMASAAAGPKVLAAPASNGFQPHREMKALRLQKIAEYSGEDFYLRHATEVGASRSKEMIFYHMRLSR